MWLIRLRFLKRGVRITGSQLVLLHAGGVGGGKVSCRVLLTSAEGDHGLLLLEVLRHPLVVPMLRRVPS